MYNLKIFGNERKRIKEFHLHQEMHVIKRGYQETFTIMLSPEEPRT